MKLKVPNKNYSITELYDTVATLIGNKKEHFKYQCMETKYDCRKINVAPNIQDGFFVHYREANPYLYESEFKMGMGMLLLNYGPKVDENLADDEVEVFDGFIC